MGQEIFKVERIGRVARCSMNCPEKMNALGDKLVSAMVEGFADVFADGEVKVIVLRGEGGNFCSGGDVDILGDNLDPEALNEGMLNFNNLLFQLHQGGKPVITEVDGFAVGGGLGLALASDMTYAAERAVFSLFFIQIAAVPDLGGAYFVSERIGAARAREMALTGEMIGAEKALEMGLINKVCPHDSIGRDVMDLAAKMAARSAKALAWTKRAMHMVRRVDLKTSLDFEAHIQPLMLMSEDHKKAVAKFLKRKNES